MTVVLVIVVIIEIVDFTNRRKSHLWWCAGRMDVTVKVMKLKRFGYVMINYYDRDIILCLHCMFEIFIELSWYPSLWWFSIILIFIFNIIDQEKNILAFKKINNWLYKFYKNIMTSIINNLFLN